MPYKAVLEFAFEGKPYRAVLFANRLFKQSGEAHPGRSVILHLVQPDEVLMFDAHELAHTYPGTDDCTWYVKRAWRKGSNVPILATGQIVELEAEYGVLLLDEGDDDTFENRIFFTPAQFYYFGTKLPKNKSLLEVLEEGQRVRTLRRLFFLLFNKEKL
jgi:hypothetical protein